MFNKKKNYIEGGMSRYQRCIRLLAGILRKIAQKRVNLLRLQFGEITLPFEDLLFRLEDFFKIQGLILT